MLADGSASVGGAQPMSDVDVHLLCAGAAQGLVNELRERFEREQRCTLQIRFGPVGAMNEALLGGARCDVIVVSAAIVDALRAGGALTQNGGATLGLVHTGVAVRSADPSPDVSTPDALKAALLAAPALYFPDPIRATAGIHFASVLTRLGIADQTMARRRNFASGAISMAEMAAHGEPGSIGCTQITEINNAAGVTLVGALPPEFGLATMYAAGVTSDAAEPARGAALIALLSGADTASLRRAHGFDDAS